MGNGMSQSGRRARDHKRTRHVWTHFTKLKKLGAGAYGTVWAAEARSAEAKEYFLDIPQAVPEDDEDGEEVSGSDCKADCMVAIKMTEKSPVTKAAFLHELKVLRRVKGCRNVLSLRGGLSENDYYCVITELCKGKELLDHILSTPEFRFNEKVASNYVRQILRGLKHCHEREVAHLDVKPENMLLVKTDDGEEVIKLIDFGCSKFCKDDTGRPYKYMEFGGTLDFAAPELLSSYGAIEGDKLKAVDMWAVGVVTYILTTGLKPFISDRGLDTEIRREIFSCNFQFPADSTLSGSLMDFISRLLVSEPEHRMTAQEALLHPWILRLDEASPSRDFDPMVVSGLKNYQTESYLKKYVARILCKMLTQQERERINRGFQRFDADSSGFLDSSEIATLVEKMTGCSRISACNEAVCILKEYDKNEDGVLQLEEFIEICIRGSLCLDPSRIRIGFKLFDVNGDGVISMEEVQKCFKDYAAYFDGSESMCKHDFERLITPEKPEGISLEEFSKAMQS